MAVAARFSYRATRAFPSPAALRCSVTSFTAKPRSFHTSPPSNSPQDNSTSSAAAQLKKLWNIAVDNIPTSEIAKGITSNTVSNMSSSKPNNDVPKHEMAYFKGLATSTRAFGEFRRVLHTGLYSQLVVMEVPVNGEIGDEVHTVDQILIITSGNGLATIAGKDQPIGAGDIIVVPAGTQHQFVTKGDQPLELITVYSPAEHLPTTVHKTKEEGDKEEDDGIDEAPEWSQQSKKHNEDKGLVKESGKYD